MQIFSNLKVTSFALFLPFFAFAQPCTDYSEATLVGDTVCAGNGAIVKVLNTIEGKPYQAYMGNKAIGSPVTSLTTGSVILLSLPASELIVGSHTIGLRSTDAVCGSLPGGVAPVLVNPLPSINIVVIGDTICSSEVSARLLLPTTQVGVHYQAFIKGMAISTPFFGTGTSVVITVPSSVLSLGQNVIRIQATVPGCSTVSLSTMAMILVLPAPTSLGFNLDASSPICKTEPFVTIRVFDIPFPADPIFDLYKDGILWKRKTVPIGAPMFEFIIPTDSFTIGTNEIVVRGMLMNTCGPNVFEKSITVVVNPVPESAFELKEDTLVASGDDKFVPVTFNWRGSSGVRLENIGANNKELLVPTLSDTLRIPMSFLSADTNRIKMTTEAYGCRTQPFLDTLLIIVKPAIVNGLESTEAFLINQIGPNPFSTTLHIGLAKTGHYHLRVVNSVGTVLHEQSVSSSELTLPTPWPSGAYYLEMEGEGTKERRKLIK